MKPNTGHQHTKRVAIRLMRPLLALLLVSSLVVRAAPPATRLNPNEEGATKIVEQIKPAIVKVTQLGFDGVDGLGSGFVISADGLIATNMHVVGQGRRLQVEFSDGRTFDVKSIHASDHHLDLAILRIDAKGLKPLKLGDSDKAVQGQPIVAMGNPEGLAFSVVQGVISEVREVEKLPMIQVAMPIERGNSGGPLLDRRGNVLGILTLKSVRTANLGFAMPVNDLKKLMMDPNTVPMERWLTIGVLDARTWKPVMGGKWTQRAGVVKAELLGDGFGGRSLCLWQGTEPKEPFEVAVNVKLDDESGAAGLAFCSDGGNVHYGFYPTAGQLRLTRFDGPDVYSWTIHSTLPSEAYKPGEWNHLRVRVDNERITCFVNGVQVIEQQDDTFRGGKVGLCKFRNTRAEFKNFRVGSDLRDKPLPPEVATRVDKSLDAFLDQPGTRETALQQLMTEKGQGRRALNDRVKEIDAEVAALRQKATTLRKLGTELHQRTMASDLATLMAKPERDISLLQAALLLARHDNAEVDIAAYERVVGRMAEELRTDPQIKAGGEASVLRLNRYLFQENGFHGNRYDYENRANSYMNEVLENREGLPITLSVLYLELAHRLGLDHIFGVSLPSRFMLGFYTDEEKTAMRLIDAFDGGKLLSEREAFTVALGDDAEVEESFLKPATKAEVVSRMIRNLMSMGESELAITDAIPYLGLMIVTEPHELRHRFERYLARRTIGDLAGAREDLRSILDNPPAELDEEQLRELHSTYQQLGEH